MSRAEEKQGHLRVLERQFSVNVSKKKMKGKQTNANMTIRDQNNGPSRQPRNQEVIGWVPSEGICICRLWAQSPFGGMHDVADW